MRNPRLFENLKNDPTTVSAEDCAVLNDAERLYIARKLLDDTNIGCHLVSATYISQCGQATIEDMPDGSVILTTNGYDEIYSDLQAVCDDLSKFAIRCCVDSYDEMTTRYLQAHRDQLPSHIMKNI